MNLSVPPYERLVRPTSNSQSRSLWNHFGFPADRKGTVLSRRYIVCIMCDLPLPFEATHDGAGDQLREHLRAEHASIYLNLWPNAGSAHGVERPTATPATPATVSMSDADDNIKSSPRQRIASYESDVEGSESGSIEYYMEECGDTEPPTVDEELAKDDGEDVKDGVALASTITAADDEPVIIEYHLLGEDSQLNEPAAVTTRAIASNISLPTVGSKRSIVESNGQNKRPKIDHNLCRKLAEVCADDMLRPDVWNGDGMSQLLRDLSGQQLVPDALEVRAEMRRMNSEIIASQSVVSAMPFTLTIDRWSNIEACVFYTLSIVRHTTSGLEARTLCTWSNETYAHAHAPWSTAIDALDLDRCQAIVLNFEQSSMDMVPAFVKDMSLPIVPCMAAVCEWAARAALQRVPTDSTFALPQSWRSDCWMTQIDNVEEWTRQERANKDGVVFTDDSVVWELDRVVECIHPLRIAMETLRLEDRPGVSLSLPLAQQLVANHFADDGGDVNDDGFVRVLSQMKKAVRETFARVILKNPFLSACSYLDPRFHALADAAAIDDIHTSIRAMCPASVAVAVPQTPMPAKPSTPIKTTATAARPPAKVGLSFFFAKPATPPTPPIDAELQKYAVVSALPLDQCPREWWQQQKLAYPMLAATATPLWSVPAMMPSVAHDKRRWLRSADEVDALLVVHDDRSVARRRQAND